MAMPLLLESEVASGEPDLEKRWAEVQKPFQASREAALKGQKRPAPSLLPRYLEFSDSIKAVHKVVMFPELQALPDDGALMLRREFAQAKLDILRLAVNRYCEPSAKAVDKAGERAPQAVADLALMQRARPDVFRYRLRQALTLETYRWQKQIEFSRFDEESFHECALLLKSLKEERLSGQMQLEVLNRLAAKGLLMALQERRPKLHRHLGFLNSLLQRVEAERSKHVRKAWMPASMKHEGTLPVAPKNQTENRSVTGLAVGGRSGDVVVTAHGGVHITVWRKRKPKKRRDDDWLLSSAAATKKREKEEAEKKDPWTYAPFFKTQSHVEDLGPALCLAMNPDGRRFFSSCGSRLRGWVQGKKQKGSKFPPFRCESIMQGHAKTITCLRIAHRHLFSASEDGTVKIWRFRSTDASQSATVSYADACTALCLLDTSPDPKALDGLHAVAGLRDGHVAVLPYSLKSQWMQGAVWQARLRVKAVPGGEPVTTLAFFFAARVFPFRAVARASRRRRRRRRAGGADAQPQKFRLRRLDGRSAPRRRAATPRNSHVAAAASPRPVRSSASVASAEYPRRGDGPRPHGIPASRPRRRRDSSP